MHISFSRKPLENKTPKQVPCQSPGSYISLLILASGAQISECQKHAIQVRLAYILDFFLTFASNYDHKKMFWPYIFHNIAFCWAHNFYFIYMPQTNTPFAGRNVSTPSILAPLRVKAIEKKMENESCSQNGFIQKKKNNCLENRAKKYFNVILFAGPANHHFTFYPLPNTIKRCQRHLPVYKSCKNSTLYSVFWSIYPSTPSTFSPPTLRWPLPFLGKFVHHKMAQSLAKMVGVSRKGRHHFHFFSTGRCPQSWRWPPLWGIFGWGWDEFCVNCSHLCLFAHWSNFQWTVRSWLW